MTLNINSKNKNYDENNEEQEALNKDLEIELRKDMGKMEAKMFEIDD